jgi:hypothetical protein
MNRICFRDTNTPDSSSTVRSRITHCLYIQECLLLLQQGSLRNNNFLVKTFFEIKPSSSKNSQVHKEKTSIGKKTYQKCTKTDKKNTAIIFQTCCPCLKMEGKKLQSFFTSNKDGFRFSMKKQELLP